MQQHLQQAGAKRQRPGLRLDEDLVLTGADGFVPNVRISLQPTSPFLDLSDHALAMAQTRERAGSNTSSSSSSEDERPLSARNRKRVVLSRIDLTSGGVDSTPFTPFACGMAKVEATSPFLDDADLAAAAVPTTKKLVVPSSSTQAAIKIDLSKRALPVSSASAPVAAAAAATATSRLEQEFAVERRELQRRARTAENRLAFALLESATRRRRDELLRLFLRRWRLLASVAPFTRQQQQRNHVGGEGFQVDDAQALAEELLRRLKHLRGE